MSSADARLIEAMRTALANRSGITEQRMFGGHCFMLNGNMLCAADEGRFMFRVGKDRAAEAMSRPGAAPMEMGGRRSKAFVWVDAAACEGDNLIDWIAYAEVFVGTLPPKGES